MKAEKDKKTGKWLIQYRYTDWQGKRRKSTKRGFATKREAEEWLRNFLITQKADFDMKFADFWKMYCADMETRLREHTMRTKKYIVELKILPYFGNKRVNDITAADIRQWQNELIKMGYSPTYLKTINNQLSAIFNYAVRYYDLKSNPCVKAGSMGKSKAEEMDFWTGEEFRKFIDSVMNKRLSYGDMVLDHDLTLDLTPEPVPEHVKGKRPLSVEQEAKVMELQQILNKLKKQEQKIYAMEKNIVQQEKCLEEVKRKLFHRKEQKELENKIELDKGQLESAKDTLSMIPKQYGYKSILEILNELKHAEKELADVQQKQVDWDTTEHEKVYEVVAANVQGNIEEERKKQSRLR